MLSNSIHNARFFAHRRSDHTNSTKHTHKTPNNPTDPTRTRNNNENAASALDATDKHTHTRTDELCNITLAFPALLASQKMYMQVVLVMPLSMQHCLVSGRRGGSATFSGFRMPGVRVNDLKTISTLKQLGVKWDFFSSRVCLFAFRRLDPGVAC